MPAFINVQGRLLNGTNLYSGSASLLFRLYDAEQSGNVLYQDSNTVAVVDGFYTAWLGDDTNATHSTLAEALTNSAVWLESVIEGVALQPRERMSADAYALLAGAVMPGAVTAGMLAEGAVTSNKLAAGAVTGSAVAPQAIQAGHIAVHSLSPDVINTESFSNTFWLLSGNAGTSSNSHFLGTTDEQPLVFQVNGMKVMEYSPGALDCPNIVGGFGRLTGSSVGLVIAGGRDNQGWGYYSVIGGGDGNRIGGQGTTISGGLENWATNHYGTIGGGYENRAPGHGATIAGGRYNQANAGDATVGGGQRNRANHEAATVGGGAYNGAYGFAATVGGGDWNVATGDWSCVAGGHANTAERYGSVGGGYGNSAKSFGFAGGGLYNAAEGRGSTIGGGYGNSANGENSAVGGGAANVVEAENTTIGGGNLNVASGYGATIGGGIQNVAALPYAVVAGGRENHALTYDAAVVGGWSNTAAGLGSTIGGGSFNNATGLCAAVPGGGQNLAGGDFSFAAGFMAQALHYGSFVWADGYEKPMVSEAPNSFSVRAVGGTRFVSGLDEFGTVTSGVFLASGSGNWETLSDRDSKENFAGIDPAEVLEKVAQMPLNTWNWKTQDAAVRHLGPTAQDFHEAFGLGVGNRTINATDADGVALAAIQGLHRQLQQKDEELAALQERLAALEQTVKKLQAQ